MATGHKLGGLKQQFIFSQCWGPEVGIHDAGRAMLSLKAPRNAPSMPLQASRCWTQCLGFLGLSLHHFSICFCLHSVIFFLGVIACMCICLSSRGLPIRTPVIGLVTKLIQHDLILTAKTRFLNKVTLRGRRGQDLNISYWGTQFNPNTPPIKISPPSTW